MIQKIPSMDLERICDFATEIHNNRVQYEKRSGEKFHINYHPLHLAIWCELHRLGFPSIITMPDKIPSGYFDPSEIKFYVGILTANHDYEISGSPELLQDLQRIVRMGYITENNGFRSAKELPVKD